MFPSKMRSRRHTTSSPDRHPGGTFTRWTAPASPGAPATTGPPIQSDWIRAKLAGLAAGRRATSMSLTCASGPASRCRRVTSDEALAIA